MTVRPDHLALDREASRGLFTAGITLLYACSCFFGASFVALLVWRFLFGRIFLGGAFCRRYLYLDDRHYKPLRQFYCAHPHSAARPCVIHYTLYSAPRPCVECGTGSGLCVWGSTRQHLRLSLGGARRSRGRGERTAWCSI